MARSILIQIIGDASQLEREFKKTGDASDKLGKRLGLNAKSLAKGGAIAAAGVAVAGTTKFLIGSVKAARESEKADMRLGQAFDQVKAKAKQRAAAQAAVQRVSRKAGLDDEELSDVLANLARSTGSVSKAQKGMALAANIARARNIPLATAAKAVEKAYLGTDTALKRVGVVVPKVTKGYDFLKTKVNALTDQYKKAKGPMKERLKAQIDELKSQFASAKAADKQATAQSAIAKATKLFAGSAERYGKTSAGASERLSVAWENLQERVGKKLLPVLTKLSLWGVRFLDWSEKNWPRFSKAVSDVYQKIRPVIDQIGKAIGHITKVFEGVIKIIRGIKDGDWSMVWKGLKQVVVNQVKLIMDTALALPKKIVTALGKKAWAGLGAIGTAIKNAAVGGLEKAADGIVGVLVGAINKVIRLANSAIGKINKVSPFPDIPKIAEVATPGSTSRSSPQRVQPGTRSSGPRDRGDRGYTPPARTTQSVAVNATVVLDHREVGRITLNQNQRAARGTVASRRGPHAGKALSLG